MCGIIGYVGPRDAVPVVLDGLSRLEYRGYDSAGVAFEQPTKSLSVVRCVGKIRELEKVFSGIKASCGSSAAIGHTRWATHGGPSEKNAHPHRSGPVVVVHNGIIENYVALKKSLQADGFRFSSETDTEVVCHLINRGLKKGGATLEGAVRDAARQLKGSYALAIMSESHPGKIIGVRKDSPLVLGIGNGELFLASDASAFIQYTKKAVFLADGEMAVLNGFNTCEVTNLSNGRKKALKPVVLPWSPGVAEKQGFKHFMLKEIHEQPAAIAETLRGRVDAAKGLVDLRESGLGAASLKAVKKIFVAACGTSWHAGLAGKYMIEAMARVPVEVDISSEFRYRRAPLLKKGDLFIAITQSGETADTLAAQRLAKKLGARVLSITNVMGSSSAREADAVLFTRTGPEIGVASTKTFTAQIASLYLLSVALAGARGDIKKTQSKALIRELLSIPDKVRSILEGTGGIEEIAAGLLKREHFLFLGRGILYPIALEGALKLKEISYIHAEGYPAGEMKHGPIALIDREMPVLMLLPSSGPLKEKILSNMEEVRSRNASVIIITDGDGGPEAAGTKIFTVPATNEYLTPILMAVPLQLLAYHIGVMRGCDVDQPRNLAKSVTVE